MPPHKVLPLLAVLIAWLAPSAWAAAVPRRVEVTRDLWISSFPAEREGNNGAAPRLKLKGIQEFFLIDFDPAPLAKQRVVRAHLHVHLEGPETLGRVTVSSITEAWVEGRGTSYSRTPGASSFQWARTGETRWGSGEPDITAVINGVGGSTWGFGDASPRDAEGWQVLPIDPAVVQARLDGRSHGFSVMDDVGSEYTRNGNTIDYRHFPNRYVASREGPKATAPFFTLWTEDGPTPAPATRKSFARPAIVPGILPALPRAATSSTRALTAFRDEFGEPLAALEFFAARGETIGFYGSAKTADVSIESLDLKTSLFAMPKLAGQVDPLVPVGFIGAPITDLEDGGAFVEIHVPKDAKSGRHVGSVRMGTNSLPCAVTVWNFTLPDRLSFLPQMNCYGLPGHDRDYYRLAHEHRTVLNRLAYGWTGRVDRKAAPVIRPDGSWDWTAWDAEFGPLLDGSAFRDLPRAGVPIEAFYLPLNENWPMDQERHFKGGYWVESAYDEAYWTVFRSASSKFADHFTARGWKEPMFEFYLNNKVYFKRDRGNRWDACSAPWIFDEPMNTQDFWALRRFGLEFWRGVETKPGARFTFRADISRPEWQRDLLDGVTSVEVVSGILRTYRDRVINRANQFGNLVYMYGSANRIGTPNIMPAAWCVETWALGGDGVVPWQTVGTPESWRKPDQLSLFYPTTNGPVPSLRLKTFRSGQQLTEYLTMFAQLSGQSRAAMGAALLAEPGLHAALEKKSEADAGDSLFSPEAQTTLTALRLRLGHWLDAKAPVARERWHDPRPNPRDPAAVRTVTPLPPPN